MLQRKAEKKPIDIVIPQAMIYMIGTVSKWMLFLSTLDCLVPWEVKPKNEKNHCKIL